MLFFTERKASKELQASGLTVRAAGSGSVAAMKDGVHARGAHVIRQSPPFSSISHRKALTRRAPCACGRRLPVAQTSRAASGGLCEPREHCNTFRAVCMHFPAEAWEFEAIASTALLVSFLPAEKSTYLLLCKGEKRVLFLYEQEKNEKKPQASGLTICAAGSGSMAAMKDGIHARESRVIRQPPPFSLTSRREALTRRAPCACGRRLPSGSYFPHGE